MSSSTPNPLSLGTHGGWNRLIASVNPASMLAAIRGMMSVRLQQQHEPEDIWQQALLLAWRDRARLEWRGTRAFRRWMLEIARNRVRDLADYEGAEKRGHIVPISSLQPPTDAERSDAGDYAGPVLTTSPGRAEADREAAARLESALAGVPEDNREVVRLRLFEDLNLEEVAARTKLGVEAVRYRFGRGLSAYHRELRRLRLVDSNEFFPP